MKTCFFLLLFSLTTLYSFHSETLVTDKITGNYIESGPIITEENTGICINSAEARLADLINDYRRSKKLPPIILSVSLTKVARMHAEDLDKNYKAGGNCNLHSWSKDARWSSCCYTPDHKRAACMWDKPRELTSYKGDGYEIAYFSNFSYADEDEFVKDALAGWKSSRGHNDIIINNGKWKTSGWKAMGVAVQGDYAVVWFGELADPEGKPGLCLN
ncbi:MAG TPA: CAP domain-containing protein [Lentimicrobium sp.]|nr:CAP domain-containing protein [Lentimicrobium sp.]